MTDLNIHSADRQAGGPPSPEASTDAGVGRTAGCIERWPVLTKLPTCLAALSAVAYFLASEGIRNHLQMLRNAVQLITKHLQ